MFATRHDRAADHACLSSAPEMGTCWSEGAVVIAMADGYAGPPTSSCRATSMSRPPGHAIGSTTPPESGPADDRDGRPAGNRPRPHRAAALPRSFQSPRGGEMAIEVSRIEACRASCAGRQGRDHGTNRSVFISLPGDILNSEAAIDMGETTRVDTAVRPRTPL